MLRRCAIRATTVSAGIVDFCKSRQNAGVYVTHPLAVARGEGSYLYDADGKKYLDFTCGIGVTNLGHCHPRLVKVAQKACGELWHSQITNGWHLPMYNLIKELETVFPDPLRCFTFQSTGAEAIEGAMRLARAATGRQNIVTFQGGFHGRTVGAASMTTSKYAYAFNAKPQMPGVVVAPRPFTTQMKVEPTYNTAKMVAQCLGQLEDLLHQVTHPSEVAMMVIEPLAGEGGYVPLPAAYYQGLRAVCDKYGILLVVDEVQSGYGRTGTMFSYEQMGAALPDVVCFAKGVANGLPLAGFVTRKELGDKQPAGLHGGTYAGNPIACASAVEVLKIFREEGILQNVADRGAQLLAGLQRIVKSSKHPIQEVRGRGLMLAFQFDQTVKPGAAGLLVAECRKHGLLTLSTSIYDIIRLIPPLTVTAAQIDEALAILDKSIAAVSPPTSSANVRFQPCCDKPCQGGTQCRWIAVPE